jgi:site-specific DNA-methyltransferase (adenine-specific)
VKGTWHLEQGDCREVVTRWASEGVLFDAIITDPPYDLVSIVKRFGKEGSAAAKSNGATGVYGRASKGFMGQQWDGTGVAFDPETWRVMYDAMKPGAHIAAFGGTRTFHRMAVAIEDAGFEIRDTLMWIYGTGFPKSHSVSKGLSKKGDETTAAWEGWGTALKPSFEPIILARKPLDGTVAANVLAHRTGAINIDGCRVSVESTDSDQDGRWPANLLHDGSPEVIAAFGNYGTTTSNAGTRHNNERPGSRAKGADKPHETSGFSDSGTAARYFSALGFTDDDTRFHYSAKASKADRAGSGHPTVKPLSLMRWLTRLICPPGGLILEPFAGSGTTLQAAVEQGFDVMGVEMGEPYCADIRQRMENMKS